MGSESLAHEVEGHMGYCLKGHESERNNTFSKIQLVGQMFSQLCTWIREALNIKKSQQITNVDIELNNKVNKTLIEFNYFLPNCLDTSRLLSVKSKERRLYSKAKIIHDNARRPC